MIEISAVAAITLYLILTLAILMTIWLKTNQRQGPKIEPPPFFKLYICEYCQNPYLGEAGKQVTRCPKCMSYNKKLLK